MTRLSYDVQTGLVIASPIPGDTVPTRISPCPELVVPGPTLPCNACQEGTTPRQWDFYIPPGSFEVLFPGPCQSCLDLNDSTHRLTEVAHDARRAGLGDPVFCYWEGPLIDWCDGDRIWFELILAGGAFDNWTVVLYLESNIPLPPGQQTWKKADPRPNPFDCSVTVENLIATGPPHNLPRCDITTDAPDATLYPIFSAALGVGGAPDDDDIAGAGGCGGCGGF